MPKERYSNERPRDRLGRPLAWGAANEAELADYDNLPLEENHRLACAAFEAGDYFPAHEAWETAWKQAKGTPDEEFFKGLSQMGAGYTHLLRGNAHGAQALLHRAASRIGSSTDRWGIRVGPLAASCLADADDLARGKLVPGPAALAGRAPVLPQATDE